MIKKLFLTMCMRTDRRHGRHKVYFLFCLWWLMRSAALLLLASRGFRGSTISQRYQISQPETLDMPRHVPAWHFQRMRFSGSLPLERENAPCNSLWRAIRIAVSSRSVTYIARRLWHSTHINIRREQHERSWFCRCRLCRRNPSLWLQINKKKRKVFILFPVPVF